MTAPRSRMFYRKEKLRGACWEYEVSGGWVQLASPDGDRPILRHRFKFYRPRDVEVKTPNGVVTMQRSGAEQWFFPDRWFSLLRFISADDQTVGYYVNFSRPLTEIRPNYFQDLDLELDLWIEPDGTVSELDREEFDDEIAAERLTAEWAKEVNGAAEVITQAVAAFVAEHGPDIEQHKDPATGLPRFILSV